MKEDGIKLGKLVSNLMMNIYKLNSTMVGYMKTQ